MRAVRLAAVAITVLATTGCAERGLRNVAALPQPTPVVVVTMSEYSFDVEPRVPSGRVVFRFRNTGRLPHRVTLLALPEDLPPIKAQLLGSERRYLEPFAGMLERLPGGTGSFAVDLEPGRRYGIVCFTVDRDNQSHAQKGMSTEFRAAGRPVPQEAPPGTAPAPPGGASQGEAKL